MDYILTIDAGTSAFKTILFTAEGRIRASYSEELELITERPGFVEFRVEDYWHIASKGIRQVLESSGIRPGDIRVVVISSQGETLLNLDKNGKPLRNAIVWIDERSTQEAGMVEREFGRDRVFEITGQPEVVPTWPATKILWQRRVEPDIYRNTAKYLMLEDYLLYKLSGKYVGEYSVHSSTLWLDIQRRRLWDDMLDFLGLDSERFPELTDSGEVIGHVCAAASRQTGLGEDTLVITGALDQAAGAIGAGNLSSGICSETTGSALAACVFAERPIIDLEHGIPCHCHALKGKYYLMAWGQTAGLAYKWFKDNFCEEEIEQAERLGKNVYDLMDEQASRIPPGCDGMVFLPHLSGAACPEFNPHAKGVFFGITIGHNKGHFIRSIMESIAYMLKKNIDLIEKMGIGVEELRCGGGGSRSLILNKIKADVLAKPIHRVLTAESPSAGVAALAGATIGIFKNVEEGVGKIVELGEKVLPDEGNQIAYQKGFQKYKDLYQSLVDLF